MASKYVESVCSCDTCKDMCRRRPCWPTPKEAQALIDKGFGARLMLDWWVGDDDNIYIVSPAVEGSEGERAPSFPRGRCTFLTKDELCELHSLGLKPFEGRIATCKGTPDNLHEAASKFWNTQKGRSVVKEWEAKFSPGDLESANSADNSPMDAILSSFMQSY